MNLWNCPTAALLTVLAGGVTLSGCSGEANPDEVADDAAKRRVVDLKSKASRIEVMTVRKEVPIMSLRLPGEVVAENDSHVASPVGGFVEKVLVREGDEVKAGQSMAWVGRTDADARQAQAEANLRLAEHEMSVVKRAGDSVSATRRIRAESSLQTAQAQLAVAKSDASRARARAPFAGYVAQVAVEEGEVLPPGGPVVRLLSMNKVKVTVSISDRDVKWVQPGARAIVRGDGGAETYEANVTRVSPGADLETRTFLADIEIENRLRRLLPGMIVQVTVEGSWRDEAITIPQYALVTRSETNGVFVIEGDKAHWRDVRIGALLGHDLVIDEGLNEGDVVAIRGHRELSDQESVLVVRTTTKEPALAQDTAEVAP